MCEKQSVTLYERAERIFIYNDCVHFECNSRRQIALCVCNFCKRERKFEDTVCGKKFHFVIPLKEEKYQIVIDFYF